MESFYKIVPSSFQTYLANIYSYPIVVYIAPSKRNFSIYIAYQVSLYHTYAP